MLRRCSGKAQRNSAGSDAPQTEAAREEQQK
jgi:hypothetical protein